jgi:hypothetical protein
MRRSKGLTPPQPSFLVREVLPQLADELQAALRREGYPKLAVQVADLQIYGRCPCNSQNCGTFYCAPPADYVRLARLGSNTGDVTVAKGKIIRVETLSSEVDRVLNELFPNVQYANPFT